MNGVTFLELSFLFSLIRRQRRESGSGWPLTKAVPSVAVAEAAWKQLVKEAAASAVSQEPPHNITCGMSFHLLPV